MLALVRIFAPFGTRSFWRDALRHAFIGGYEVFKWMLPAVIIVRLLRFWGLDAYLNYFFAFLMGPLGLPEWTSLVWVAAILANLYAGIAVLAQLGVNETLTAAQMSILGTVMLIAHSLPVEARITQTMRVRFFSIILLRLGLAMLLGICLRFGYAAFDLLQTELSFAWMQPEATQELPLWQEMLIELRTLVVLSFLVAGLILLVEIMKVVRLVALCEYLMQPFLRLLGISSQLAHITALGTLLGLTYSSGYLIVEAKRNSYALHDLAGAVIFLSLCHAIIEDTLILWVLGADVSAILFARLFISLLCVGLLMRGMQRMQLLTHLFIAQPKRMKA